MPVYLPPRLGISHSEALAESYASATAGVPALQAIELIHPLWTTPARAVLDWTNHTLGLEADAPVDAGQMVEFIGMPFRYVLPKLSAEGQAPEPGRLEIDNVSLHIARLMLLAKNSTDPVTVIHRVYLASDKSAPHQLPVTKAQLSGIYVEAGVAGGVISSGDLNNRRFPVRYFNAQTHPTLTP
jgi:hypothetical protein